MLGRTTDRVSLCASQRFVPAVDRATNDPRDPT